MPILPLISGALGSIFKAITEYIGIQKTSEYDRMRLTSEGNIEKFKIMYGGVKPQMSKTESILQLVVACVLLFTSSIGLMMITYYYPDLKVTKEVERTIPIFISMFFPMSVKGTIQVSILTLWYYWFSMVNFVVMYLFTRIPFNPAIGTSLKEVNDDKETD